MKVVVAKLVSTGELCCLVMLKGLFALTERRLRGPWKQMLVYCMVEIVHNDPSRGEYPRIT